LICQEETEQDRVARDLEQEEVRAKAVARVEWVDRVQDREVTVFVRAVEQK
jgi:hypothetical protein